MDEPVHILITGAAGQIGYILTFSIANGSLFGSNKKIFLHLLEIPVAMKALNAIVMELNDCNYPNLVGIIATHNVQEAFSGIDIAFLVGTFPKKPKMSLESYIECNGVIFKEHGLALSNYAKKTVKVLIVGTPVCTNTLVCMHYASSLDASHFSALTLLDHNRIVSELAQHLSIHHSRLHKVCIWGNRSATQVPDISHATYDIDPSHPIPILSKKDSHEILEEGRGLVSEIVEEGYPNEVAENLSFHTTHLTRARGGVAASGAHAAVQHMKYWLFGTPEGEFISMAIPVPENEPYGIKKGVVYSFPCTVDQNGNIHVVENLDLSEEIRSKIVQNETEIREEANIAAQLLNFELE